MIPNELMEMVAEFLDDEGAVQEERAELFVLLQRACRDLCRLRQVCSWFEVPFPAAAVKRLVERVRVHGFGRICCLETSLVKRDWRLLGSVARTYLAFREDHGPFPSTAQVRRLLPPVPAVMELLSLRMAHTGARGRPSLHAPVDQVTTLWLSIQSCRGQEDWPPLVREWLKTQGERQREKHRRRVAQRTFLDSLLRGQVALGLARRTACYRAALRAHLRGEPLDTVRFVKGCRKEVLQSLACKHLLLRRWYDAPHVEIPLGQDWTLAPHDHHPATILNTVWRMAKERAPRGWSKLHLTRWLDNDVGVRRLNAALLRGAAAARLAANQNST